MSVHIFCGNCQKLREVTPVDGEDPDTAVICRECGSVIGVADIEALSQPVVSPSILAIEVVKAFDANRAAEEAKKAAESLAYDSYQELARKISAFMNATGWVHRERGMIRVGERYFRFRECRGSGCYVEEIECTPLDGEGGVA